MGGGAMGGGVMGMLRSNLITLVRMRLIRVKIRI